MRSLNDPEKDERPILIVRIPQLSALTISPLLKKEAGAGFRAIEPKEKERTREKDNCVFYRGSLELKNMDKYRIYSVEDDEDIAHIINVTLTKQGFEVLSFPDGESFLDAFALKKPDMILLDMMLPGIQGKDLLKEIRHDPHNDGIVILIISAKTMTLDKVDGLDLGADDYIEKPFDLMELMSRVNAHVRRSKKNDTITLGDYVLDLSSHLLRKKGIPVELTPSEYTVLALLFTKVGSVVTREELAQALYNDPSKSDSRTLDMHIKSIRAKISDRDQTFIVSVYGSGYKING